MTSLTLRANVVLGKSAECLLVPQVIHPFLTSGTENFEQALRLDLPTSSFSLLRWQNHPALSDLESTLIEMPASVDSKPLTQELSPLHATLMKNRGRGVGTSN